MRRWCALMVVLLGIPGVAMAAKPAARVRVDAFTPAATAARVAAAKRDMSRSARATAAGAPRTTEPGTAPARRIETTHIAGEVPVPQVLFITARDQRRFTDFHHARYLKSSRELIDATPIPSWMTVTGSTRRETAP